MHLHSMTHKLTFASLVAFEPCVIKLRVAGISTVLEPSAAAEAATASAGFIRDALGTFSRGRSSGCTSDCGDRCCMHAHIGKRPTTETNAIPTA